MSGNIFFRLSLRLIARIVVIMPWSRLEAQSKPAVDPSNAALANPPVPVLGTKPCTVQLYPKQRFGAKDANNRMRALAHDFSYQPPAACKGPWARVVLEADFSVDPGNQYGRTASIWLDNVNLYFGTTEEPSRKFGPRWQIGRDLTDYASLLQKPDKGVALINNWVDSQRRSYIHASAWLLFYPAGARFPAPKTPNDIYPLNTPNNLPANLQTRENQLVRKIDFPRNTMCFYMDVFTQSQFQDEPWDHCLAHKYLTQTTAFAIKRTDGGAPKNPIACGGDSYREVEVSIDGQPPGLAPIYPWVFTGGIDHYLWRPTPSVQTLNFVPYRIDLIPFAGLLSNGRPHSVSVRVLGAHHSFSVAAALLGYHDRQAKQTGGAVTSNTLKIISLETPVTGTQGSNQSWVNGDVLTRAKQSYVIEQVTHASSSSNSSGGTYKARKFARSLDYLLTVNTLRSHKSNRSQTRTVQMQQGFDKHIEQQQAGLPTYRASVRNTRTAADKVVFNYKGGHITLSGSRDQTSMQTFAFNNPLSDCYHVELKAVGGKVSSFT